MVMMDVEAGDDEIFDVSAVSEKGCSVAFVQTPARRGA